MTYLKKPLFISFVVLHVFWCTFVTLSASTVRFAYLQIYGKNVYPAQVFHFPFLYRGFVWQPLFVVLLAFIALFVFAGRSRFSLERVMLLILMTELMWVALWFWGLIQPLASTTFSIS